jgi:hypothetical protein
VPLDVNCFLIRHRDRLILSDAGSGHTMGPTLGKLPQNLRAIGVAPDEIDILLLTHLHRIIRSAGRGAGRRCSRTQSLSCTRSKPFWLDRTPMPDDLSV